MSTLAHAAVVPAGATSPGSRGARRNREGRRLPGEEHFRARARGRHDRERGANPFGALLHACHAEAVAMALLRDPAAVVDNGEPEPDGTDGAGMDRNLPRPG